MTLKLERKNYYAMTGSHAGMSDEGIKRAYRKKLQMVHPDRGGDTDVFIAIKQAFEMIKEKPLRDKYFGYMKTLAGVYACGGCRYKGFTSVRVGWGLNGIKEERCKACEGSGFFGLTGVQKC